MSDGRQTRAIAAVDLECLLLCTLRYAMGRMTHITDDTARIIKRHWRDVNDTTRQLLLRDLKGELDVHNRNNTTLGAHLDHQVWMQLLQFMTENQ